MHRAGIFAGMVLLFGALGGVPSTAWAAALPESAKTNAAANPLDTLEAVFRAPPAAARPWVYWFWMDGNISREGITADLEAMQRVGIGGFILMEVDVGVPRGPVRFMTDPWRAMFRHAVLEAERLGLEMTVNAGPGWTGSGGPWVTPEQSMQHLVASELEVTGPMTLDQVLPQAPPRAPHSVHAPVPAPLVQARDTFYRDVAVLAYPTPPANARLTDSDEKALYYRNPFSSVPGVKPYLPTPTVFPMAPAGSVVEVAQVTNLTERVGPDGRCRWSVPPGRWTIRRFGRTTTGANTRPAPEAGIGFESDKFDAAALDAHFAAFVGKLVAEIGERPTGRTSGWTMLHIDSWEMGAQNWSPAFREEFQRRRGYDPLPYLPAMLGVPVGSTEIAERFLWDVRQTAQELVIDHHARHLQALGRRHGFGLSIEPYDMNPCADLSLGGVADVPMAEFWSEGYGFDTVFSLLEAVSLAHVHGRPVVAAEAFTADHREAWKLHPGTLKAQADWAFALGINRLVVHRFAHQPWLDRRPGMTMGPYGVHYDRTQTWWEFAGPWHAYLQRCQALLRWGTPVADVCYLLPEGAPQVFQAPPGSMIGSGPTPDRRGYAFDACAPEALGPEVRVEQGLCVFPSGMRYRVLVLPRGPRMTPELLRRVRDLVQAGATIIGPRPVGSPSLQRYPACDGDVLSLADELWGRVGTPETTGYRRVGRGQVIVPTTVAAAEPSAGKVPPLYGEFAEIEHVLVETGVLPDFESEGGLRALHRRSGPVDLYFVSNRRPEPVKARALFRVEGRAPAFWDPVQGTVRPLPQFEYVRGRTAVELELPANGSGFVVFGPRDASGTPHEARSIATTRASPARVGPWEIVFAETGREIARLSMAALRSWSEESIADVRHFSGVATYRTTLDLTEPRGWLDLGRVEVMARVKLNDQDLGVVWTAPFRVDLSPAARVGANRLEIQVANLWPNRLIGDASRPPETRSSWTTWNPYRGDEALLPSGLLGPLRVFPPAR